MFTNRDTEKMGRYSFRMPNKLREDFEKLAKRHGVTPADAMRQLVEKAVEQGKQQEDEDKKQMLNSIPPDQRRAIEDANKAMARGERTRITY